MPTTEAIANLKRAEERMRTASEELRAFVEKPDRTFSSEERAKNRRLLDDVHRTIEEYWGAFEQAAKS